MMISCRKYLLPVALVLVARLAWAVDSAPAPGVIGPITEEAVHKITLQAGYGPADGAIGAGDERFHSLRHELDLDAYRPEKQWARWQFHLRTWVGHDSAGSAALLQDEDRQQVEGWYAELRQFYVRGNLLGGDPRFSLTVGRQRFTDRLGIWWDDTFEALRLDYRDTFSRGFLAVGQKFSHYNTDVRHLDPQDEDVRYVMGEFAWRWHARQWVGVRMLHEHDGSGRDEDDPQDFTGRRAGLFVSGEGLWAGALARADYHLEAGVMDGRVRRVSQRGDRRHDVSGWAVLGEAGVRFDALPWQPRLVLRAGLTDRPGAESDGFHLNRIQSDRLNNPETYSTRLAGSFIAVDVRNLQYAGIGVETRPTPASVLELRLTDLRMRNAQGELPVNTDFRVVGGSGRAIGQAIDVNYYWKMFPFAYGEKRVNLSVLLNAGYLRAGRALGSAGDAFQASFRIVVRY